MIISAVKRRAWLMPQRLAGAALTLAAKRHVSPTPLSAGRAAPTPAASQPAGQMRAAPLRAPPMPLWSAPVEETLPEWVRASPTYAEEMPVAPMSATLIYALVMRAPLEHACLRYKASQA